MTLNNFKRALSNPVMANKFKINIITPPALLPFLPNSTEFERDIELLVKTASFPSFQVGVVEQFYQGKAIKFAGDPIVEPFEISVNMDNNFLIRDFFERWHDAFSGTALADSVVGGNITDYQTTVQVHSLSKNLDIIKSYVMKGAFPSMVGPVQFGQDSNDTIQEFPVTLTYTSFESNTTRNNDFIDTSDSGTVVNT